jgi:ankyrin repeat protein
MTNYNDRAGLMAALFRDTSKKLPDWAQEELDREIIEALLRPTVDKNEVVSLIFQGASVSAVSVEEGKEGWTPLMIAVDRNLDNILEILLHFHANPNAQNKDGDTALMLAIKKGDDRMFRHIMREYEADQEIYLNLRNQYGHTALMLAAEKSEKDWVQRMLFAGADAMPQDNEGNTAVEHARFGFEWKGAEEIALMIEKVQKESVAHINAGLPAGKDVAVSKPLAFKKAAAPVAEKPEPVLEKERGTLNLGGLKGPLR